jgi:hypothetical protein
LFHVKLRVVAALAAVLLSFSAAPAAGGELPAPAEGLPACPADARESTTAPAALPTLDDPAACRARPSRVEPAATTGLPVPRPGSSYHHLGATTVDEWGGVLGRLTVRDPAVRRGSHDFVAARFMAKRATGDGRVAWLEAGWAEAGWSGRGAQRIYTFDSEAMSWVFFDDYRIGDGDQVWIYLHGEPRAWQAWLWWGERWQLLASPELPLGRGALLEQYLEVHRSRPGRALSVPPVVVDNVWVRAASDGRLERWRAERVPTVAAPVATDYCLDWQSRYDTWSAGDCAATVQE